MTKKKIIVVTPVKNEEWILKDFLKATSIFADHIIIADQSSTDNSKQIAKEFEKVILIDNPSLKYDEAFRQKLLIETARKEIPEEKIIYALDADEIITASSINSNDWSFIHDAKPGTTIYFEKPDLVNPISKCIRYKDYFPMAYVDDNSNLETRIIHSRRIPFRDKDVFHSNEIKFMHLAQVRTEEYWARQRLYCMIENINNVQPLFNRIQSYSRRINEINQNRLENTPLEQWIEPLKTKFGIDLYNIKSDKNNQFNNQIIEFFKLHGSKRFYYDPIWDFNWDNYFTTNGYTQSDIDAFNFKGPNFFDKIVSELLTNLLMIKKKIYAY